jgi:hypothetical protein
MQSLRDVAKPLGKHSDISPALVIKSGIALFITDKKD